MSRQFKREPRYVVFKIKDILAYLGSEQVEMIEHFGKLIAHGRARDEKAPFNAVVVEQDWPEFEMVWDAIEARMTPGKEKTMECHKLDTDKQVFFYEQDFYVLSNFSAFRLNWKMLTFDTSEAAYHWEKFTDHQGIQADIRNAPSAHEAFKIAEQNKRYRRPDWDAVKLDIMRDILRAKAEQHEYVRRKLLATGDRELIEDSWRDDFWGWGPNHDGQNMLGKLWMEVRAELNKDAREMESAERRAEEMKP